MYVDMVRQRDDMAMQRTRRETVALRLTQPVPPPLALPAHYRWRPRGVVVRGRTAAALVETGVALVAVMLFGNALDPAWRPNRPQPAGPRPHAKQVGAVLAKNQPVRRSSITQTSITGRTLCLCMAFAQLTFRESLRDIEVCLRAHDCSRGRIFVPPKPP
jgi:hypothetical protein